MTIKERDALEALYFPVIQDIDALYNWIKICSDNFTIPAWLLPDAEFKYLWKTHEQIEHTLETQTPSKKWLDKFQVITSYSE